MGQLQRTGHFRRKRNSRRTSETDRIGQTGSRRWTVGAKGVDKNSELVQECGKHAILFPVLAVEFSRSGAASAGKGREVESTFRMSLSKRFHLISETLGLANPGKSVPDILVRIVEIDYGGSIEWMQEIEKLQIGK